MEKLYSNNNNRRRRRKRRQEKQMGGFKIVLLLVMKIMIIMMVVSSWWPSAVYGSFVVEESSLTVTSPQSLKGTYQSAIGNFGVPQYGGTLAGSVRYYKDKPKACDPFVDPSSFKPSTSQGGRPVIALVDRGGLPRFLVAHLLVFFFFCCCFFLGFLFFSLRFFFVGVLPDQNPELGCFFLGRLFVVVFPRPESEKWVVVFSTPESKMGCCCFWQIVTLPRRCTMHSKQVPQQCWLQMIGMSLCSPWIHQRMIAMQHSTWTTLPSHLLSSPKSSVTRWRAVWSSKGRWWTSISIGENHSHIQMSELNMSFGPTAMMNVARNVMTRSNLSRASKVLHRSWSKVAIHSSLRITSRGIALRRLLIASNVKLNASTRGGTVHLTLNRISMLAMMVSKWWWRIWGSCVCLMLPPTSSTNHGFGGIMSPISRFVAPWKTRNMDPNVQNKSWPLYVSFVSFFSIPFFWYHAHPPPTHWFFVTLHGTEKFSRSNTTVIRLIYAHYLSLWVDFCSE